MRKNKTTVPLRRKREGKTNYRKRRRLLQGGKPRIVIRPTLSRIVVQIVNYSPAGDTIVAACDSQSLRKLGWDKPLGSIPAAYLTGLLCAKKARKAGVDVAILDTGLYDPVRGSRIYAALKGAIDGGLLIPHDKQILPPEDRLFGKHVEEELPGKVSETKTKIEELS